MFGHDYMVTKACRRHVRVTPRRRPVPGINLPTEYGGGGGRCKMAPASSMRSPAPHHHHPARRRDGWILNGAKTHISLWRVDVANNVLVVARTED